MEGYPVVLGHGHDHKDKISSLYHSGKADVCIWIRCSEVVHGE